MTTRREFITNTAAVAAGAAAIGRTGNASTAQAAKEARKDGIYWPGDARLVISISPQFEADGQPAFGVESPFSGNPLPEGVPDLPARTWFKYG